MQVTWAGGRKILTDKLFVVITTSFLDKHVSIDNNLLGGASEAGKPDVASREMVDGLYVLAHIASVAAQDICDAVFATGHSRPVYEEMNAKVRQVVDQHLSSLPVVADRHWLHPDTFDDIKTRLLSHFGVTVDRFGPGGSTRKKRAWVASTKLKYRNARRLMFAQKMAQYIATLEENTHAVRAKHYLFWMLVNPIR